jgi:hypothetical protein
VVHTTFLSVQLTKWDGRSNFTICEFRELKYKLEPHEVSLEGYDYILLLIIRIFNKSLYSQNANDGVEKYHW